MFVHHVLHTRRGCRPFAGAVVADEFWRQLRRAFPYALAACLMPDHLHLLDETFDLRRDRDRLIHVAASVTRRLGGPLWMPVPMPEPVAPDKLLRVIRYIHLNPSRAHLVDDLLSYRWSTHRGVIGAEHNPWVPATRIARVTGRPVCGFAESFHAYVSSDPSVSPCGSPFPERASTRVSAAVPLCDVVGAARAATYWCSPRVERHAIALLGIDQGWPSSNIAAAIGIASDSVRRLARRPDPRLLAAAKLCLGDPRLRVGVSIRFTEAPELSEKPTYRRRQTPEGRELSAFPTETPPQRP